eukprot:scaffold5297_cov153-Pinguiococcus_pyrenoidosus.AAC.2
MDLRVLCGSWRRLFLGHLGRPPPSRRLAPGRTSRGRASSLSRGEAWSRLDRERRTPCRCGTDAVALPRILVQGVALGFGEILSLRAQTWNDGRPLAVGLRGAELASRLEVTPASLKRSRRTLRAGCLVRLRQALGSDVLARRALAARGAHVKAGRGHGSNLARKLLAANAAEAGLAGRLPVARCRGSVLRGGVMTSQRLRLARTAGVAEKGEASAFERLSRSGRAVVARRASLARRIVGSILESSAGAVLATPVGRDGAVRPHPRAWFADRAQSASGRARRGGKAQTGLAC